MMNLYMVSLGGKAKGCNIEVHDIQFVVAKHIDDTVEILRNSWYGLPEKLHMDSYKRIDGADGYKLQLLKQKPASDLKLYFVHMGGYIRESTQEQHDIGLLVGTSEEEVKQRANDVLKPAKIENHVDSIKCIENCLLSVDGETYYIQLSKEDKDYDQAPDWFGYRRIDN